MDSHSFSRLTGRLLRTPVVTLLSGCLSAPKVKKHHHSTLPSILVRTYRCGGRNE